MYNPKINVIVSLFTWSRDERNSHPIISMEVLKETFYTSSNSPFASGRAELLPRRRGSMWILWAFTSDINEEAKKSEMEGRERCIVGMFEKGGKFQLLVMRWQKVATLKFQIGGRKICWLRRQIRTMRSDSYITTTPPTLIYHYTYQTLMYVYSPYNVYKWFPVLFWIIQTKISLESSFGYRSNACSCWCQFPIRSPSCGKPIGRRTWETWLCGEIEEIEVSPLSSCDPKIILADPVSNGYW